MSVPKRTRREHGRGEKALGPRFLLLAVAALAAMLLDHHANHLERARQALSVLVHPIRLAVDAPFTLYRSARTSLEERAGLLEENSELRDELRDSRFQLLRLESLELENTRLRELLGARNRLEDSTLVAEILAGGTDPSRQRLVLDRGSADGVYVGQAVVGRNGIIGQVILVEPWSSEALLITDADHLLPVLIGGKDGMSLRTIARGTGDERLLELPFVTNSADVEVGDPVLTSGTGELFPSGYLVGHVKEVHEQPGQEFAKVVVELGSELNRDQEVLLVFSGDHELPAAVADSADSAESAESAGSDDAAADAAPDAVTSLAEAH